MAYDISEPRRLRKVFKTMQGFGEHLQLSLFQCDLTAVDRIEMQATLEEIINHDEDKVLIIDLGPTESFPVKSMQALGKRMKLAIRVPVIS
ncbi:MAG TPA: CRISPR-associated endonuclease Cas2 [Candidatus Acidoferrales bacterium]|nr:CRISPR-associated endonuclease Cas2 [Candidatus Acidoferrales bacterium]